MSLDFEASSSQYAEMASAIVSAYSWSFAAWIKAESLTNLGCLMAIATSGSGDNFWKVDSGAAGTMRFRARTTGVSDAISVGTVDGTWQLVVVTANSATSRYMKFDGETKVQNTTNRSPSGMNRTSIGRSGESSGTGYFDGLIARPTFWNGVLSDANIALLEGGDYPTTVDPSNLLAHWKFQSANPGEDSIGSNDLTITGATYSSDEPPIDADPDLADTRRFFLFM